MNQCFVVRVVRTSDVPGLADVMMVCMGVAGLASASSFLRGFVMALVMSLHALYSFVVSYFSFFGFVCEFNGNSLVVSVPLDSVVLREIGFELIIGVRG
jgi:hypothetical protein